MADSSKLLFIPGIILIPSSAYYSGNYSRTIGSGLGRSGNFFTFIFQL